MTAPPHELPLVARQDLVDQVLDRLLRPDDVRERPDKFIRPGFFGLAGIGKSRLLREIETRAQAITPYVVAINFDRRQAAYVPGTPWDLLRHLIDRLADIDRSQRNPLQRMRWAAVNPFHECQTIIAETGAPTKVSEEIYASGGSIVSGVQMTIDSSVQPIPPNLQQALDQALVNLGVRTKTQRQFGGAKPTPRPLIVILLDTLETASKPIRAWLPAQFLALFAHNLHDYHVLLVAAGRQEMPGLIITELPPLTGEQSVEFLRRYVIHQQTVDRRFANPAVEHSLREDTVTRRAIVDLAAGIPLLLQLLADLAAHTPGQPFAAPDASIPESRQARIDYVVDNYIQRLAAEAHDDQEIAERYRLLLYNAVPRRIPNDGLLGALLRDQPGTAYKSSTDYRAMWNRLSHEAFVHRNPAGGLIYHEVIRAGFLTHLQSADRQRWRDLHRRAAAWWRAEPDEAEALYHAVQADYAAVIGELLARIQATLDAKDWPLAQAIIGTTTELKLEPTDLAWITLFKAELAWGEGDRPLAHRRLARLLTQPDLPADLDARLAADLESWFALAPDMTWELVEDQDRQTLPLLLWWCQQRAAPQIKAYALRGLGEAARMQARYADALGHYQAALAVYREIGDRRGEAHALLGLGEAARMQDRSADALGHYQATLAVYREIGDRRGEAHALLGLGEAARMQARSADMLGHYQAALAVYREIGVRLGEAHALRGLGDAALMQARSADARPFFEQAFELCLAIGMPQDTLRFALSYANETLDQAQRHREHDRSQRLMQQALALARWLQAWAERASQQSDPAISAQYNLRLQALRARLASF